MSLTVTPKAATQIRKALDKRGGGIGLRLAVKTSGCSGYAYALEFVDALADDDLAFDSEGVKLLVDAGANVSIADRDGVTPLIHARRRSYIEMVTILERAGGK